MLPPLCFVPFSFVFLGIVFFVCRVGWGVRVAMLVPPASVMVCRGGLGGVGGVIFADGVIACFLGGKKMLAGFGVFCISRVRIITLP